MKKMMNPNNKIEYIDLLSIPGITAFSTCRGCIIEGDNYSGFNACHYTGDDINHVNSCRTELCEALNIDYSRLIIPRQTHSLNVALINKVPVNVDYIENVDALVTTMSDVAIAVNTADCVPLVLIDEVARVIAVAHSGWKGTVGRIASKTVTTMVECGADVARIKVAMGPCICGDCFEVGDEVVEQFKNAGFDNPQVVLKGYGYREHIDLPQACRQSLVETGILEENIKMPIACSRCNQSKFFSARRLGINSGRTLTVVKRSAIS